MVEKALRDLGAKGCARVRSAFGVYGIGS